MEQQTSIHIELKDELWNDREWVREKEWVSRRRESEWDREREWERKREIAT